MPPKNLERKPSYRELRNKQLNGLLYPKKYSVRLLTTSCFAFPFACLIAILCGLWDITIYGVIVTLCSINYWRRPCFGLRRNMDISFAVLSVFMHIYIAFNECSYELRNQYLLFVFMGIIFFILSEYYGSKLNYNLDTLFHCIMHIWGVIVNIWFYPKLMIQRQSNQ